MHRDLKPSNVLIDANHRICICDFGSSRFANVDQTLTGGGAVGTMCYMAPEQWGEDNYTGKVDIYSFALILYEIVVGALVFSLTLDIPRLIGQVVLGKRAEIPEFVCPFVQEIIGCCRSGDAKSSRPSTSFSLILRPIRSNTLMTSTARLSGRFCDGFR
jgi:serine/threonine protein kinase